MAPPAPLARGQEGRNREEVLALGARWRQAQGQGCAQVKGALRSRRPLLAMPPLLATGQGGPRQRPPSPHRFPAVVGFLAFRRYPVQLLLER